MKQRFINARTVVFVYRSTKRKTVRISRTVPGILLLLVVALSLISCAGITKRNALPEPYVEEAGIEGIPFARFWGDAMPPNMDKRMALAYEQIKKLPLEKRYYQNDYLALSGGGANGAFGAGLLVGWTASGTRPTFRIVSGISTGALIAPFAFLGPEYDQELKKFYTTTSTSDILKQRTALSKITGESFTKSYPLRNLLYEIYDEKMVAAIAAEYEKGRRLFIGTTNLDAGRPVIWNITAIAASGHERAGKLISEIALASASIPGVFPPVFIEVQVGGKTYDEVHVDGGTASQIFLYPPDIDIGEIREALDLRGKHRMFVIRNAKLDPEWIDLRPSLARIAGRSMSVLIRHQGIGDLYRIYRASQRDGVEYNLAYIPRDFSAESNEPFDPEYMSQLFDLGYQMARDGYPWEKEPYGFATLERN